MNKRDLLSLRDLTRTEMEGLFSLAASLKGRKMRGAARLLAGKTMALVFEKPSLRTRVSFEVGMMELGGRSLFLGPDEVQLGVRESPRDCSRVLSRWVDLIVVRTFAQETVEEMARYASVPVINALTDVYHPCQILADCLTLLERGKRLDKLKIAFIGDGNNIVHSWMLAAEKIPFSFNLACPDGYGPDAEVSRAARENGARVEVTHRVEEAVRGADVLYTDVWASMGQEQEREARLKSFQGFQINDGVLALAQPDAVVMHCLPAHRGEEITDAVMEGPRSAIFDQAENRLHAQKAVMAWILGKAKNRSPRKSKGRK